MSRSTEILADDLELRDKFDEGQFAVDLDLRDENGRRMVEINDPSNLVESAQSMQFVKEVAAVLLKSGDEISSILKGHLDKDFLLARVAGLPSSGEQQDLYAARNFAEGFNLKSEFLFSRKLINAGIVIIDAGKNESDQATLVSDEEVKDIASCIKYLIDSQDKDDSGEKISFPDHFEIFTLRRETEDYYSDSEIYKSIWMRNSRKIERSPESHSTLSYYLRRISLSGGQEKKFNSIIGEPKVVSMIREYWEYIQDLFKNGF